MFKILFSKQVNEKKNWQCSGTLINLRDQDNISSYSRIRVIQIELRNLNKIHVKKVDQVYKDRSFLLSMQRIHNMGRNNFVVWGENIEIFAWPLQLSDVISGLTFEISRVWMYESSTYIGCSAILITSRFIVIYKNIYIVPDACGTAFIFKFLITFIVLVNLLYLLI